MTEGGASEPGPVVVLVGAPGSGKTTVGKMLADRLGIGFRDTDADVEALAGQSIADIFAGSGEAAFREMERAAVALALAEHHGVLSLGGGAVLDHGTRERLGQKFVVWLRVTAPTAARRVGLSAPRPVLIGNVRGRLAELLRERAPLYQEVASLVVDTDQRELASIIAEIAAVLPEPEPEPHKDPDHTGFGAGQARSADVATRIPVTGGGEYDVIIGAGVAHEVVAAVPDETVRVAVIFTESVAGLAGSVINAIAATGRAVLSVPVPSGEAGKTVTSADRCWTALGQAGFTRSDLIVGVGGGATTDLAGFVAATWLRGIPVIHVPTTLLAMVDAGIGGKAGVNTSQGKNLVGAFHAPKAVVIDPAALRTVPREDHVTGLAEVIKAGLIRDQVILDLIEADPGAAADPASRVTEHLIARAARVKADVVSADFRECGPCGDGIGREMLNYGHTLAHAIELVEGYRWRHGAAVSVGMVFAAELAGLAGYLSEADIRRHRDILSSVGLPVDYSENRWPDLLTAMAIDKKARAHALRFVILDGIGNPRILENPEPELLTGAFARLSAKM